MSNIRFARFRNDVLRSLNKFNVPYKLFGGAVIQLIEPNRETQDLDIFIQKNLEYVKRLILALEDCGFNTKESLIEQIFGFNTKPFSSEKKLYSTCSLYSSKENWKDYHIDLAFDIGDWCYNTTPLEVINQNGILIQTVSYLGVAKMKANIYPQPRQKDIMDIQVIAKYLNLDTSTGKPIERKCEQKKKGWFRK